MRWSFALILIITACAPAQPLRPASASPAAVLSASPSANVAIQTPPASSPMPTATPAPTALPSPSIAPSVAPTLTPTASPTSAPSALATITPVTFASVQSVLQRYCRECHSFPGSYDEIRQMGARIRIRAFVERSMPRIGSFQAKDITHDERALIARWVDEGMKRD